MASILRTALLAAFVLGFSIIPVQAGPVFLTGHDPDFHGQFSVGAQDFFDSQTVV